MCLAIREPPQGENTALRRRLETADPVLGVHSPGTTSGRDDGGTLSGQDSSKSTSSTSYGETHAEGVERRREAFELPRKSAHREGEVATDLGSEEEQRSEGVGHGPKTREMSSKQLHVSPGPSSGAAIAAPMIVSMAVRLLRGENWTYSVFSATNAGTVAAVWEWRRSETHH